VDPAHHFVELRLRELREDWQRQHFARCAFALGALPFPIAEVGETGLQMEREWVIDGRADSTVLEKLLERVTPPIRDTNGVLVEDRLISRRDVWRCQKPAVCEYRQRRIVVRGIGATPCTPRLEVRQLG
jgi:hypothetical protein